MGGVSSKSPLERRNTIARRSQRRTILGLKPKIDNIYKDIKKLKSIEEDTNYNALKAEIEHTKKDLERKGRDLQPQLKNAYENAYQRINQAQEVLDEKLRENQEKADKKESNKKSDKKWSKTKKGKDENESEDGDDTVQVEEEKNKEEAQLAGSQEKRKTVELKFVQIIPDEDTPTAQAEVHNNVPVRSPEEKRKSILKVGVPVMPGAMMNEITHQSHRILKQYDQQYQVKNSQEDIMAVINDAIENLQTIEYDISEFVGKKHGNQYNRIRDTLNKYLIELNQLNPFDEYTLEQLKICKNYVGSCLNFLDDKALEEKKPDPVTSDDEVFENNNLSHKQVEANFRLQKLLKNTAV